MDSLKPALRRSAHGRKSQVVGTDLADLLNSAARPPDLAESGRRKWVMSRTCKRRGPAAARVAHGPTHHRLPPATLVGGPANRALPAGVRSPVACCHGRKVSCAIPRARFGRGGVERIELARIDEALDRPGSRAGQDCASFTCCLCLARAMAERAPAGRPAPPSAAQCGECANP
jgi:hypothetical protein